MRIREPLDGNNAHPQPQHPLVYLAIHSDHFHPAIMADSDSATTKMEGVTFKSDTFPFMNFIQLNATRNLMILLSACIGINTVSLPLNSWV